MESVVVEPERRRGRKRKNADVQNMMVDCNGKKKMVETRSLRLVGRYVKKEFEDNGVFLGKIMFYDSGLYRISYEDGDCEDLDSSEIKVFLVEDCDLIDDLSERKKKLDMLLSAKDVKTQILEVEKVPELANVNQVESSLPSELGNNNEAAGNVSLELRDDVNDDVDVDSSSDSCYARQRDDSMDMEEPLAPPPELPPSSGHIGVPEEYVSHLLSVHSFLRSFSIPLYLCPFGLDDFVGALNCSVANTLLDSVHVALLRVLKRHIERLSSCGSELAINCMRYLDWSLLDNLTWPVYLVHYLVAMGYINGADWKGVCAHFLERDYYTLSAGRKLTVLQILCDDVLDSEELRDEIDMREESEVGIDMDSSIMVIPTDGSRRVHPRYSKTFASKNRGAITSNAQHHEIKYSAGNLFTQVGEPVGSSADEDGNSDECLICGMDGLLICCDGCPSSYHSRCLGLNKMHMPDGSWYCPECKINATEPKILQGTTLRGGHNFGVDPYGQVFVATCDHLLVLKASVNSEICLRYYNRRDIPTVLQSLYSKAEHVIAYSEICKGITGYWELHREILPCNGMSGVVLKLENEERGGGCTNHLDDLLDKSVPDLSEFENSRSCVTGISFTDVAASSLTNCFPESVLSGNSSDKVTKFDHLGNTDSTRQQPPSDMNTTLVDPAAFSGLKGQPADINELSQQSTSSVIGTFPYTKRNCNISYSGPLNGASREAKSPLPGLELNNMSGRKSCGNPYDSCLYMGSSFKTSGYINNYLNGDYAASAAANLAILSSEENHVSRSRSSSNRRKVMSENISLQVKAFSSAAMRFLWPSSEKKLVEIPRERCSWCFSCKAAGSSKRGCLLNAAALNATKGAAKVLASVRSLKNGDGRLPGIATYIIFMEESLSSLLVGPFINDTFRKRWRKQVEQATDCTAIKILLLELEENVRTIALSGDWIKLVDGCSTQSATCQIAANAAGSTQKRKPGRRGRKPSAVVEVATDDCQDVLTDFTWWRGGTMSKLMFHRGILPCSMIRKAARQGGLKKIPGIHYVGGNETPKCSRQLIWRSAVEMSRNIAQLAVQVRYFDLHVRWSDLVRPEQNPADGKGPEIEASAFRNALICDKKIVGHEIRYCIAFGSQKHLPSRVTKNIAEVEQLLDDGKERYWFAETRVPLYLIKEYEEKMEKNKPVDVLTKLQRRQQKVYRKNVFSYLWRKQDDTVKSCCSSCHQDVLYRNAVKCSACQGFCHEQCATSSTVQMNEEVEFLITCKRCCETRAIGQPQRSCGSPTSPLLLQGRDFPNVGSSASGGAVEYSSEMELIKGSAIATESKTNNRHWGLIWRKKNSEDTGIDFRLKNIIPRTNPDMNLTRPVCRLCNKPYNADLTYARCEACASWYHAEALELDESRIVELVGFKCCKCRRIRSPDCPYSDSKKKKKVSKDKIQRKAPNLDFNEMDSNSHLISEHLMEVNPAASPSKAEVLHVQEDDPLYTSLSEVKQCNDATLKVEYELNRSNVSCSGPRKLPVRRHIKQENDSFHAGISAPSETNAFHSTEKLVVRRHKKQESNSDLQSQINSFAVEVSIPPEANTMSSVQDSLPNQAQWDVSKGNFDDVITLDYDCLGYDDIEFEPQTYFSFNELLASDDGAHANDNGSPPNVMGNWEGLSVLPDNGTLEISYDQEEPIISVDTPFEIPPCNICFHSEPCPDLSCQMCGVWIHSCCSPWIESSSWENDWRCGNCREWR